jgi:hypothetical protein
LATGAVLLCYWQGYSQNKTGFSAKVPLFTSYKVPQTFKGKPAPVNLRSHPKARVFRTALREAARKGPNFAGHYTVVEWGCGTECQAFAIVDANNGRVHFPEIGLRLSADFRRDSALFVANPPKEWWATYGQDMKHALPPVESTYYRWTGRRLIQIAKVDPSKIKP